MFQQEINCFRIQLVLVLFILIGGLVGDGPSCLPCGSLRTTNRPARRS